MRGNNNQIHNGGERMRGFAAFGLIAGMMVVGLSACKTYHLQELKTVNPTGNAYQMMLSKHYQRYAEEEEAAYDWQDSAYFASKGLQLAYGHPMPAESPDAWDIPENVVTHARNAYEELLAVQKNGAPDVYPEEAAGAQFYYDCWLEQLEEGWQEEEINHCYEKFDEAMQRIAMRSRLDNKHSHLPMPVNEALKPEHSAELSPSSGVSSERRYALPPVKMPEVNSYLLYFGWNEAEVSTRIMEMLEDLIASIEDKPDATVVINGHADRSGDERYNFDLSRARANYIKEVLIDKGMSEARIKAYGFGETDPAVNTEDGLTEAKNRRVEVFFHDS